MNTTLIFDLNSALDRVESDRELLCELIQLFFEEFEKTLPQLQAAVSASDAKRITELGHFVKSSSGNIGAMRVYYSARQLETLGRTGQLASAATTFDMMLKEITEFKKAFDCSELNKH